MNQKSKYMKKYGMPKSNANTLLDIGAVYHKMLLEVADQEASVLNEAKKSKKLADPKAKFGTKPGKGGEPLELVTNKKIVLDPKLQDFAHKDSGPDLKQLAEPIDPKVKKFQKNNHYEPCKYSSANEAVINSKNVELIVGELVKQNKDEAYLRLCEYKTLWGKNNFVNLLTVAAVNGHTETIEEFFSYINKTRKNTKESGK